MDLHDLAEERVLLANACRVLAQRGLVDDILGHVSMRLPDGSILIRVRGPQEQGLRFTTVDDIRIVRADGGHDLPEGYSAPNELPLHLAVYAQDPDAGAVVHAHPPQVVVATLAGIQLRPVIGAFDIPATRMARAGIPVLPSAALIRTQARGEAMMAAMGDAPALLLHGHGLVTRGASVPEAVLRALSVTRLAEVSVRAHGAGAPPRLIEDGDWEDLPDLGGAFNTGHVWRFHLRELAHAGLRLDPEPPTHS